MTKTKWLFVLLLCSFVSLKTYAEDDVWSGLGNDDALPETTPAPAPTNDASATLTPAPTPTPAQSPAPASPPSRAPQPSPMQASMDAKDSLSQSKEEEIRAEHDLYLKRKEEQDEETLLRQRIYHDGSKNTLAFDYNRSEFKNF